MLLKHLVCASALSLAFFATYANAGSVYDITFTDQSSNQLLSNGAGTFTVNAAGTVTRFDISFTVLQTFVEDNITYSPGDVLTFDTASDAQPVGAPLPTYDPQHNAFNYGQRDYAVLLIEQPSANPDKGGRLAFASNNGLGVGYLVSGLAYGEFYTTGDTGVWSVKTASPTSAPEPGSGLLLGLGIAAAAFFRRKLRVLR